MTKREETEREKSTSYKSILIAINVVLHRNNEKYKCFMTMQV